MPKRIALRVWKNEFAPPAAKAPLSQGVHHHRSERNCPLTGLGLRPADGAVTVGALADMERAPPQIDIGPPEAAKFACP